ncbi:unnamed protein product [Durusdinium trenchii]|uniref:Right handed beta helix domain-containing protein n=1 Tax=Durusdinium trenchii TaxID=1381693 RepID=A0ABP0S321_9DINO
MADKAGGFFSREQPERVVASGTEVRTVPSALYPTIASAVPTSRGEHPILAVELGFGRDDINAMGRKRAAAESAPSAPGATAAERRGQMAEVWCFGLEALSSNCCARLAQCSKGFYVAVRDAVAERITLSLADGCLQADLASHQLHNPILALSHLESLAHSQFLFGGLRGLLRSMVEDRPEAAICLLESPPSTDALCDLLFSQLAGGRAELASAWARLAALLYHYRTWLPSVLALLLRASPRSSRVLAKGASGELGQLLHGLPQVGRPGKPGRLEVPKYFLAILEPNQYQADSHVMPRASEGKSLAVGKLNVTKLPHGFGPSFAGLEPKGPDAELGLEGDAQYTYGTAHTNGTTCQLLERLVFPPANASLLLHLSLPMDGATCAMDAAQSKSFLQNLKALEDVIVIEAQKPLGRDGCQFVLRAPGRRPLKAGGVAAVALHGVMESWCWRQSLESWKSLERNSSDSAKPLAEALDPKISEASVPCQGCVASDRLAVACAKAHKGGDANAKVAPCEVYYEALDISSPVVLVGAGKELPTIWGNRPDGIVISSSSCCVLRHLRLCAEPKGHAIAVRSASPLIEDCDVVGAAGEAARGARAGVDVRGHSQPVLRGCRIYDHSGAGVAFSQAGGMVVACDIARCACGVWLEGGANPLIWRTTLASHRGAGVVVRADASGCVVGNTILRNGAGGLLVESNRKNITTIVRNRVWANCGCDLRQSPAKGGGLEAGSAHSVVLANTVGHFDSPSASCGIELLASWPETVVTTWTELKRALRRSGDSPGGVPLPEGTWRVIRICGRIQVEEPLLLDRPVVLAGEPVEAMPGEAQGELSSASGSVVMVDADAAVVFWRLTLSLAPSEPVTQKAMSCVEVCSGRPVLVDCTLKAESTEDASSHGIWASVDPLWWAARTSRATMPAACGTPVAKLLPVPFSWTSAPCLAAAVPIQRRPP